ncbi:MAG: glucuronate isomerase [Sedimentisphaeraceae bacterium JB056]
MENKNFINDEFCLETKSAQTLYHEYAKEMPIIDYHCHLNPSEVASDKSWDNITQVWLYGDHYKWRAMRSNGINEEYCTGKASDRDKFEKFAETMPYLLRNPMYHWSHLELKRYFGIDELLSPKTSDKIWTETGQMFKSGQISARKLMKQSNVKLVCTTDDPTDDLEDHIAVAKDSSFDVKMLPTWRPDKAMTVDHQSMFNEWVDKLGYRVNIDIATYRNFIDALERRQDFFHDCGCRLSDHGIETVYAEDYTDSDIVAIFNKIRGGSNLDHEEKLKFKSAMLFEFCRMNHRKGWTQQIHYGVMRNNNSRMLKKLGPDTGFDSIGDFNAASAMSKLFNRLDQAGKLTKTIIYNINPSHNEIIATMLGNFQDGETAGKMQFGSGWWFLDQKDGMEKQIEALSQLGLLSRFVGMLTDSRSFLSYTRHEYFRRILCNILGNDMEKGLIPQDFQLVGRMVQDICYNNANKYFGFDL